MVIAKIGSTLFEMNHAGDNRNRTAEKRTRTGFTTLSTTRIAGPRKLQGAFDAAN